MKFEMTEKDQKLLMFLGIFVAIVAIGYWGIIPMISSISDIEDQMIAQQDLQSQNDMKVAELGMLEIDNDELEKKIVKARENYFPVMKSDEVDKYFTGLALEYNLSAYDLQIEMPSESTALEPYQYSEKAKAAPVVEEEDLNEVEEIQDDVEGSEEEAEPVKVDNGIYAVTITQVLGGKQKDFDKFIEYLSNSPNKFRIVKYSYSEIESMKKKAGADYEIATEKALELTVEIYMCSDEKEGASSGDEE